VTGIKCAENTVQQVLLKFGSIQARIDSVQPESHAAGVCRLTAAVPSFVEGDAVPVILEVVGQRRPCPDQQSGINCSGKSAMNHGNHA